MKIKPDQCTNCLSTVTESQRKICKKCKVQYCVKCNHECEKK